MTRFLYLHGFASSPGSFKASRFKKEFSKRGIDLIVPELDGGNFENLTVSSQIKIARQCLDQFPEDRYGLIGSSMGGYLAALLAQSNPNVAAMYLMAPGFNFTARWAEKVRCEFGEDGAIPGLIKVFHYRYNDFRWLSTGLFADAAAWDRLELDRSLPCKIVHGVHDDTVDIEESRRFAATRPWVRLVELDSDHTLMSRIGWIVEDCFEFFSEFHLIKQV